MGCAVLFGWVFVGLIYKLLSIVGILLSFLCVAIAVKLYPGEYDLNRDYISTLLRGNPGEARLPACIGVVLYCLSLAAIFDRLGRRTEFSKYSMIIRIGGIGSMVYNAFAITPLHDLVVTISIAFFIVAILPLLWTLYVGRHMKLLFAGTGCLVLLFASATMYYTGLFGFLLPWSQRVLFASNAAWLVALDWHFPGPTRSSND